MSDEPMPEPRERSAYVLEKTHYGQMDWSLFFVYAEREHIRALLQDMYVDGPDDDARQGQIDSHIGGESADLWLIEHGRRTGHVDLRPFIRDADPAEGAENAVVIDRAGFEAAVPAALEGVPLQRGETLHLVDAEGDFRGTAAELPALYPHDPVQYGMQVWVEGRLSDEPAAYLTDPDPGPEAAPKGLSGPAPSERP
ncbi:hypothetical protein [Streptomyces chattanoogensis]|uniref:hypothetical protein n=1 Tax=Streptomyces chattanoogensis TaxID=66876 RepID=UPI00369BAAA5